ncbi:MAG TPA: hypothetical protein VNT03_15355 [Baekduia sp.]|nr:hypothetical protein [Baekduia sp.]
MDSTATRPLAVVTGASSGIGLEPAKQFTTKARDGFEALMAGKERAVSHSARTNAQVRGSRFVPDSVKAALYRTLAAEK